MSIRPAAKFDTLTWLHIQVNSREGGGGGKSREKREDCRDRQGRCLCASVNRRKNQRLALSVPPIHVDTIIHLGHRTHQPSVTRVTLRRVYDSPFNAISLKPRTIAKFLWYFLFSNYLYRAKTASVTRSSEREREREIDSKFVATRASLSDFHKTHRNVSRWHYDE